VRKRTLDLWVSAILGAALLAHPSTALARSGYGTLQGVVVDSTGSPLPDASIVMSGLNRSAYLNRTARFRLSVVPPGQYTVRVHLAGWEPESAAVAVIADSVSEVRIQLRCFEARGTGNAEDWVGKSTVELRKAWGTEDSYPKEFDPLRNWRSQPRGGRPSELLRFFKPVRPETGCRTVFEFAVDSSGIIRDARDRIICVDGVRESR